MGVIDHSDEALVAEKDGIARWRGLRRQLEELRWDSTLIMDSKADGSNERGRAHADQYLHSARLSEP